MWAGARAASPIGGYKHQIDGEWCLSRTWGVFPRKEVLVAKTKKGKKIVPVKPYTRNGVQVKRHKRSTND